MNIFSRLASGVAALAFALLATAAAADVPPALFLHGRAPSAGPQPSPAAAAWARVEVDPAPLAAAGDRLGLELLPGEAFVATRTEVERRGPTDLVWRGRLDGEAGSQVVLTLHRGVVAGAIFLADRVFEVGTGADGGQWVARLDFSRFPPCAVGSDLEPLAPPPAPALTEPPVQRDAPDQIDVMIFYTPQARDAAGGVPQIEATAQAAVDMANTAFTNSDMEARFRLVHTELSSRNDTGNISSDLNWLRGDATVATRRNEYNADLVSLFVENGGSACGIGYLMGNEDASAFGPSAFQVTDRGCAVGNLTYAHEHGHNMGLNHDPANGLPPGSAYQPDAFGHFHNSQYRTVLSYSTECASGCTRQPYFSNPAVSFLGLPTGILNERDNHRVSNLTAPFAANWRVATFLFADGFETGDTAGWSLTVP